MSEEEDMLAQVSEILNNLLLNVANDDGLDSEDAETLKSYLNKRNNDLNLAIQISQALLVKHENDQETLNDTENKYNNLLDQETEYKEIIDKTVAMLEEEKSEKDRISLERSELRNKNNNLKIELEDTKLKLDDLSNKLNNLEMLELELKNTKSIIELKDKENNLMSKDVSII